MKKESSLDAETSTISCPCGAPLQVNMRSLKPVQVCPECKDSLTIVVTVDPGTQKRKVGILVTPAAVIVPSKRKASAPTQLPVQEQSLSGVHNPKCACGSRVPVDLRSVDSVYSCSWCGACYTAVAKRDEMTGSEIPLLMSVNVLPLGNEKPRTASKPPLAEKARKNPASRIERAERVGQESLLVTATNSLGAQPLLVQGKEVKINCFCGDEIAVDEKASRQILDCPQCALSLLVLMAIEPKSKTPMAITLQRTAKMPTDLPA
jgi:hypothetical protein